MTPSTALSVVEQHIARRNEAEQREIEWHKRFIAMSELVASWSKDPSTKCGAVIVRPDRTVASVGYNGFPRGCDDDPAIYANRPLKYARTVHAEVNAILAAREPLHGYTIYTTPTCDRCATCIIQAGIDRVVCIAPTADLSSRWQDAIDIGLDMYAEAGVRVDYL